MITAVSLRWSSAGDEFHPRGFGALNLVDRLRRFEATCLKSSEEQCHDPHVQVALTSDSHLYSEELYNIGFET
jgi:hypothetical protein